MKTIRICGVGRRKLSKLSETLTRTDLTDREIANILGGLIGCLPRLAKDGVQTVRAAVKWWAENDEVWEIMDRQTKALDQAGFGIQK